MLLSEYLLLNGYLVHVVRVGTHDEPFPDVWRPRALLVAALVDEVDHRVLATFPIMGGTIRKGLRFSETLA